MRDEVESGLRGAAGAGLGALLGGALSRGKAGSLLAKRFGVPATGDMSGRLGIAMGAGLGSAIASPDLESAVGSDIGGALGLLGGAAVGNKVAKGNLLKYLLATGAGATAGAGLGAAAGESTGLTPRLKKLLGITPEEYGFEEALESKRGR